MCKCGLVGATKLFWVPVATRHGQQLQEYCLPGTVTLKNGYGRCCCCRDGRFPLSWLEQQLTAAGSSSSSTTGLYNSLTGLLSFLNLPGSLLEWLPIKSLTLRHMMGTGMDLLTFYYKAAAMQAVDSMLSYNPLMTCSSSGGKQRVSLFLITTSGICSAPLNMFAVDVAVSSSDISSIANAPGADDRASCGIIELSSGLDTRIDFKTTAVAELSTVQASAGSSSTVLAATTCVEEWKSAQALADAAVGPQHPLFGQHVKEALLAAGSSSKIPKVFGSGVVTVVVLDSYGNAFKGRSAPATVWFVSW
jgi:hypothetical protein